MLIARRLLRPLLFALLAAACQPAVKEPAGPAQLGPAPVILPEGFVELGSCFGADDARLVIARDATGRPFALLYPSGPISTVPPLPIDGAFVHCQQDLVERDDGVTLERWLLVARGGEGDNPRVLIHLLTPRTANDGGVRLRPLARLMKRGSFRGTRVNRDSAEKAVLYSRPPNNRAILIDLKAGREIEDSELSGDPDALLDVEFVAGWRIEITRANQASGGDTGIRLQALGPRGEGFEFVMPGAFAGATDGGGVKSVITHEAGTVYQDLVRIPGGPLARPVGVAGNGVTGEHRHLQYDEVDGQGRFVNVVYDRARNETTVRIVDMNGAIVGTTPLNGEFRRAIRIRVATTVNSRPALLTRKVVAIARDGVTDGIVIDLLSGRQLAVRSQPGSFTSLSANPAGAATLTTSAGSIRIPGG